MKQVIIKHFDKTGSNVFTEKWKLKTPLTGNFKRDQRRLKTMVRLKAHSSKKYPTPTLVVIWGDAGDADSFLLTREV